jgi:hypothetical protein
MLMAAAETIPDMLTAEDISRGAVYPNLKDKTTRGKSNGHASSTSK